MTMDTNGGDPTVVGWREWVRLDELCNTPMRAKVDTGARTSSLHAHDLQLVEDGDKTLAEFWVVPEHGTGEHHWVRAGVMEFRDVLSSTGHQQNRPVICTPVRIGPRRMAIEITLTTRDEMGYGMLLGRSALADRFLVDPGRSFCTGVPQ